jgi:hypothetical protein
MVTHILRRLGIRVAIRIVVRSSCTQILCNAVKSTSGASLTVRPCFMPYAWEDWQAAELDRQLCTGPKAKSVAIRRLGGQSL